MRGEFRHMFDKKLLPRLKENLHKFPSVKIIDLGDEMIEFATQNHSDHNRLIDILYRESRLCGFIEELMEDFEEWEYEFTSHFTSEEREVIAEMKEMISLTKKWMESEII